MDVGTEQKADTDQDPLSQISATFLKYAHQNTTAFRLF